MKIFTIACAFLVVAAQSLAQKETQLPKDLPAYGPERPLSAPTVKIAKLDNGLTVWLVSEPGFPKVAFSVAVRGGMAADPSDRPGLSQLLGNTIGPGYKDTQCETDCSAVAGCRRRSEREPRQGLHHSFSWRAQH